MRRSSGLWTVLLACASCGLPTDGAGVVLPDSPPLDALPLRDALLADPSVIAAVPASLRRRLGERFEAARRQPSTPLREILPAAGEAPALLHALDRGRQDRGQDALIVGALTETPVGVEAAAIPDDFPAIPSEPTFALDIPDGAPSAALERCALSGRAVATLQGLARDEAVSRVRRVVSWPVAAARIERTLYVNAAWLAAMCDDAGDKEADQEAPAPTPAAPRASSAAPSGGAGAQGCAGGGSAGSAAPVPVLGLLPAAQVAPRTAADDGSGPDPDRAGRPPRTGPESRTADPDPKARAGGGSETSDYVLYTLAHEGIGGDEGTPGSGSTTTGPLNAASGGLGCGGGGCSSSSCSSSSNSCSSSSSSCSSGSNSCSSGSGSGCSSGSGGSGCSSGSSGGSCSSGTSGNGCTGVGSSCDTPNPTCQTQDDPCDPNREPHDPNRDCCRLCAVAPMRRNYDNIPGAVTLGFVLAPLALLSLLGRTPRRARAGRGA